MKPASILTLAALALAAPALAAGPQVSYPAGYRQWTHVKSMAIVADTHPLFGRFGGFHHVYANPEAERALVKGGRFPDGSVLVFDLLEARNDAGAWTEGPRKLVAVMEKRGGLFRDTGGWGFEAFEGDSRSKRTVTAAREQCFDCHQSQHANDFVFSGFRP